MNGYWQDFVTAAGHLLFDFGKADYSPLLFGGEKLRGVFRDSPIPLHHITLVARISDPRCGDAESIFDRQVAVFVGEASRHRIPEIGRAEIPNEDGSSTIVIALVAEQRRRVLELFEECLERVLREMPPPQFLGVVSPSYIPSGEHAVASINNPLSPARLMGPKLTDPPN